MASSAVHVLELFFLIILQVNVDTVTEKFENVGEEDWIITKTEEDCIQLVQTVKCELEVSVVCWCVLW